MYTHIVTSQDPMKDFKAKIVFTKSNCKIAHNYVKAIVVSEFI